MYYKAFPFVRRWWDKGISSTYKKVINKLDIKIEKFNCDYNFKLVYTLSPKFNKYYYKTKITALKNQTLNKDDRDIVKMF